MTIASVFALIAFVAELNLALRVYSTNPHYLYSWSLGPYVLMIAATFIVRSQLFRSHVRWWAYALVILAVIGSHLTLRGALHDLDLYYLDSHGRYGCIDPNRESYLINDFSVSVMPFAPGVFWGGVHWIVNSKFLKKVLDLKIGRSK